MFKIVFRSYYLNLILYWFQSLQTTGIRRTDPRLKAMMITLNEILKERKLLGGTSAMDSLLLNRELFTKWEQVLLFILLNYTNSSLGCLLTILDLVMLQLLIYFYFRAIKDNHKLISRAFQSQFVVPEFGYFCKQIVNLYEKIKSNTGGKVIWVIYLISSKYLLIISDDMYS